MSREFTEASGYLLRDSGGLPAFAYPISICFWMNIPHSNDQNSACGWRIDNTEQWGIELQVDEHVRIAHFNDAWFYSNDQGNTFSFDEWSHVAAILTNSTTWRCVINGDWANSGTYSGAAQALNQPIEVLIGMLTTNLLARIDGQIAHWALWGDIALSQAQVEALAGPFSGGAQTGSGANPLAIANHKLLAYLPLVGTASPEPDEKNDYDFTIYEGAPQGASDPDVDAPPQFMRPEADGSVAWTRYPALLSRDFNGSTQEARATYPLSSASPETFTVAGWFNSGSASGGAMCLWSLGDADADQYWEIRRHTTDAIRATQTPNFDSSITTNTAPVDTWFHVAHICRNDAGTYRHRVVLDGDWANSTEAPYTRPTGLDLLTIGALRFNANDYISLNGMAARFAVWDGVALSQANVEALAEGASPYSISIPTMYVPLGGNDSPEPDVAGTFDLTLIASPSQGASGPTVPGPNFECVDEEIASDSDYVSASAAGLLDTYDVPTYDDPGTDEGFIVRYRVKQLTGGAGVEARMYEATQPEFVQSEISEEAFTGDPNIAVTLPGNVVSGNLIVGAVIWDGAASYTLSSVVDDRSSTYTTEDVLSGEFGNLVVFHAIAGTSGSCTVTVTLSGNAGRKSMIVHEVSGAGERDQYAAQVQTNPGGGTDAVTSGNVTTATSGQYIFGVTGDPNYQVAKAAGTGYTIRENAGPSLDMQATEDRIQAAAGPIAATFTITGFTETLTAIATFKAEVLRSADPAQRFAVGTYEWDVDPADVADITDRSAVRVGVLSV